MQHMPTETVRYGLCNNQNDVVKGKQNLKHRKLIIEVFFLEKV